MKLSSKTSTYRFGRALARVVLCAGFFAASAAAVPRSQDNPEAIVMIRMQSGMIYWGELQDHTADNVTFKRLESGGIVTLPWSMLEPVQRLGLRTQFGYVDLSTDEVMVEAGRLLLTDGREIVGIVLGTPEERAKSNVIRFQTEGRILEVPDIMIRSFLPGVQVPALDVYTKEDLYRAEVSNALIDSALSQYELAQYCEKILDYPHSLEHYNACIALDPGFKPKEMEVILKRVQRRVDNQEQVDFLSNVDREKRRKHYDNALNLLVEFDAKFVDSPLRGDRLQMEERVIKARDAYMHLQVSKAWFSWMGRLSAKAGREKSFEESLAYLDEQMSQEILRNVTGTMRKTWMSIEEDQVLRFFLERKKVRWKPASYGLGTWLLGEEEALKGGIEESEEKKPASERDKARAEQAEKINRWMRNQEMAKRSSKSADDLEEVEKAWVLIGSSARRNWITAYYAENSGDLDVRTKPELRACSECAGRGIREIIITGSAREGESGGRQNLTCPTCHGIGRVRRIRYR
ncbi:MAG: hypothetical protein ACI8X5_000045 [Planctomycetota bacterium]|jgi:hypothetical protein